jgi:hypothetical protein
MIDLENKLGRIFFEQNLGRYLSEATYIGETEESLGRKKKYDIVLVLMVLLEYTPHAT